MAGSSGPRGAGESWGVAGLGKVDTGAASCIAGDVREGEWDIRVGSGTIAVVQVGDSFSLTLLRLPLCSGSDIVAIKNKVTGRQFKRTRILWQNSKA